MTDTHFALLLLALIIIAIAIGYQIALAHLKGELSYHKAFGQIVKVANKDRRFGSATSYKAVRVKYKNLRGVGNVLLLTDDEIKTALERAKGNEEDIKGI